MDLGAAGVQVCIFIQPGCCSYGLVHSRGAVMELLYSWGAAVMVWYIARCRYGVGTQATARVELWIYFTAGVLWLWIWYTAGLLWLWFLVFSWRAAALDLGCSRVQLWIVIQPGCCGYGMVHSRGAVMELVHSWGAMVLGWIWGTAGVLQLWFLVYIQLGCCSFGFWFTAGVLRVWGWGQPGCS